MTALVSVRGRAAALSVALFVASVSALCAQTVGINFTAGTTPLSVSDAPGIVAGGNWNNVNGNTGTGVALVDSSGAASSVTLTFSAQGAFGGFSRPQTGNAATNQLYTGGLFTSASPITISLTGIPYANYDVYVFASADTSNNSLLSVSNGATTFYYVSGGSANNVATNLLLTTGTSSGSPTSGPAQYQLFTGLTGSSFSLSTTGGAGGVISNNVFGLQVVAVPEPASVALLLGAGAIGLVWCARRKRK